MQYNPETLPTIIESLATELKTLSERTMPKDFNFFGPGSGMPKNSMKIACAIDVLNHTLGSIDQLGKEPAALEELKALIASSPERNFLEDNRQIITQAQGSFSQMTAPTAEDRQHVEELFSRIHEVYDCLVAEIRPMIETESAPSPSAR